MVPIAALRTHLRHNHPKLVDIEESEEETTANAQDDLYTEVVYLEHDASSRRASKSGEKTRKPKKIIEKIPLKRRLSSSDEEPLLQRKKTRNSKNDDEIEQFGRYITCLLKKIPQETSMELQMDIVNLVLKKQLELKRNETSVLAARKMAAVQTDDGCEAGPTPSYQIEIKDAKTLSNGYSYSIEKIVESNE